MVIWNCAPVAVLGPQLAERVIVLARERFVALDYLARATGTSTAELLDNVDIESLDRVDG